MANTSNLSFSITDKTKTIATPGNMVVFVEGETLMGPPNDPKDVIGSWTRFKEIYGGYSPTSDFPLLCQRMLENGASLRVNRITDGTGVAASMAGIRKITFDKEFSGTQTMKVTINGVDTSVITFGSGGATTHALFMALLVDAIIAHSAVGSCTYCDTGAGTADHFLLITPLPGTSISSIAATITGTSAPAATVSSAITSIISQSSATTKEWFTIKGKYVGAEYNKLYVMIEAPTNGVANYFNFSIYHTTDGLIEKYENQVCTVLTGDTAAYLTDINNNSSLIEIEYVTPQSENVTFKPVYGTYGLVSGADGSAPDLADYVGDSDNQTGFHAFDPYDDAYSIAAPEKSDTDLEGLATAGESYASNRGDLKYMHHIDNGNKTTTTITAERDETLCDSKSIFFTAGGLKVVDPILGTTKEISELADVLALEAKVLNGSQPWLSFANLNRGTIGNTLGVVNNFGSPAKLTELQVLANDQVNMVLQRNGQVCLWDDYTGQKVFTQLSFASILNLVLYIKKGLKPTLEYYLGEPCDFPLFQEIYYTVTPFLDSIKNGRGFFSYEWQGDQFAGSLDKMQINKASDVAVGKYKVLLKIKPIAPLKEFTIEIYLTPAGLSFS